MSLGNVFVRSIVREIGRNYGKSISNNLLGDSHSTPVRVVGGGSYLGQGSGGIKYRNQLEKICKTWTIKGPTATFNVAQNMYKFFFDLVDEAQSDGNTDVNEVLQLMKEFSDMRPQLKKVEVALEQLEREDLAKKFKLDFLSMGMSGDYQIALECGATHIRIGTHIFGERN